MLKWFSKTWKGFLLSLFPWPLEEVMWLFNVTHKREVCVLTTADCTRDKLINTYIRSKEKENLHGIWAWWCLELSEQYPAEKAWVSSGAGNALRYLEMSAWDWHWTGEHFIPVLGLGHCTKWYWGILYWGVEFLFCPCLTNCCLWHRLCHSSGDVKEILKITHFSETEVYSA